jgi:hypothetical protein
MYVVTVSFLVCHVLDKKASFITYLVKKMLSKNIFGIFKKVPPCTLFDPTAQIIQVETMPWDGLA